MVAYRFGFKEKASMEHLGVIKINIVIDTVQKSKNFVFAKDYDSHF